MKRIKSNLIAGLALAIIVSGASAQPSRLAWVRGTGANDIVMDTGCDVLTDNLGRFVVVGGSKQPDGSHKGCITVFNRNRSVVDVVEVTRPGGGSLMFHLVRQVGNKLYVAANGSPSATGAHRELRFFTFDLDLNPLGSTATEDNPAGLAAEPTDIKVDANGNAYICGTFEKAGPTWQTFLRRVDNGATNYTPTFTDILISSYSQPKIELNGIIAILIGLLTPDGPELRSYSPSGGLNWSFGASIPTFSTFFGLCTNENLNEVTFATGEGQTSSDIDGYTRMINRTTGAVTFTNVFNPGVGLVSPRDPASGQATGKTRATWMFDPSGSAPIEGWMEIIAVNHTVVTQKLGNFEIQGISTLGEDKYGETGVALVRPGANGLFTKYNSNDVPRFSWGLAQTGFVLPNLEQSNAYEPLSGDIAILQEDGKRFSLTCIQQAPVGVSDFYQPRSGRFFRPLNPVTFNDRYAGGATITVTQQPTHGSLNMGANGIFNYTSAQGYVGLDSFKYTLTKPGLSSTTVTVNLNVRP
ncbi:MAG: Ig-like domain-containing protein [Fimbriimonadaceae bacterium]